MSMNFSKTPSTVKQQIEILKERGCIIEDEQFAEHCLTHINYYRLAHYFAPFFEKKGKYKEGTSFAEIMNIYNFDRMLRRLIMTYLEEIEISLRAHISNYHSMKYGALGYLNPSSFAPSHNHQSFMSKIGRLEDMNKSVDFVAHHKSKYGGIMPLWAAMELFSFGMLVYFLSDMQQADKKELCTEYYNMNFRTVEDRLSCISDLRNACAHYTRLYDNPFEKAPKGGSDFDHTPTGSIKDYLLAARSLYPDKEKWDRDFTEALTSLSDIYDMYDKLDEYGF